MFGGTSFLLLAGDGALMQCARRTFDVNVLAQFSLLKAFLPHMLEQQGGHIVRGSSRSVRTSLMPFF